MTVDLRDFPSWVKAPFSKQAISTSTTMLPQWDGDAHVDPHRVAKQQMVSDAVLMSPFDGIQVLTLC